MRLKLSLVSCVSVVALTAQVQAQTVLQPEQATNATATATSAGTDTPADQGSSADIVVTASKTGAQTVATAPLAIQAISGDELAAKQITTIDNLITAIPGASQSEQLGEFIRSYSIRGSGSGGAIGDPLIGYYVDEIAYATPNAQFAPGIRVTDIDRVEVLRGPYGTLYGQGAMGGTIIFHTKDPSLTRYTGGAEAYISAIRSAKDPSGGASAALSIPLVDGKLGLRISGGADYRAGYADVYSAAPTGTPRERNANDSRKGDVRAVLLWKPDDNFTARLQYLHFGGKQDYSQQLSSVKPAYLSDFGDVKGFEKTTNDLFGATLSFDLGFATLTSATSYIKFKYSYLYGYTFTAPPIGQGGLFNGYDGKGFSQELRLSSAGSGPFHWVIGGFYNDARNTVTQGIDFAIPVLNGDVITTTKTKNYSGFGEVSYDLFDGKLVPLAGIRVYHDDRTFNGGGTSLLAVPVSGGASPTVVTWRGNLSFHPDRSTTVYFNAGTGFRSGIIQSPFQVQFLALDGISGQTALRPDRVRNFEVGFKGVAREARLSYDLSLYHLKYDGLQSGLTTSGGIAAFASLGEGTIKGIDLSLNWRPIEGLTLGFSGDINDAKYDKVDPSVAFLLGGISPGQRLINTPKYTLRFDVGYTTEISPGLILYTNASASPQAARSNQAGQKTPEFTMVDATIGLQKGPYSLELFGQNLTDQRGPWFIRPPAFVGGPIPRTLGLRVRASFD